MLLGREKVKRKPKDPRLAALPGLGHFKKVPQRVWIFSLKQMNKLLREVPTMESWLNEGSSDFVQVTLHRDFIQAALVNLRKSIEHWLDEPKQFCDAIGELFLSPN